jgi:hypothetical protein
VGKLKGKTQFERVCIGGRIILTCVVKKCDGIVQTGFMWFKVGTNDHLV